MKRLIIVSVIFLFFLTSILSAFSISGNNMTWSPVSDLKFLYSVAGKSSSQKIWKSKRDLV